LVDGSGSMKGGWEVMTFVLKALGRWLLVDDEKNIRGEPKYRVAVIQFSSTAEVVVQFTSSASELTSKCHNLPMLGGSTATDKGFDLCYTLFTGDERGATCCCILFTDGAPDNQLAAEIASNKLATSAMKVEIVGIGIGKSVDETQLTKVTPGRVTCVADFGQLEKLISDMSAKPCGPPTVKVSGVYPRSAKLEFDTNEDYTQFKIQRYDHNSATFMEAGKTRLRKFLLENLAPNTEHTFQVHCCLRKGHNSPSTLIHIKTPPESKEAAVLDNLQELNAKIDKLRTDILGWRPPENLDCDVINIVILGRVGAGKSSFINTVCSALYGCYQPRANVGSRAFTFTLEVTKYPLTGDNKVVYINLWDVYGWQLENYQHEFAALLAGNLRSGFREGMNSNSSIAKDSEKLYLNDKATFSDRMHAAILLTDPFYSTTIGGDQELKRLAWFMQQISDIAGLQGHLLMTKLDAKDQILTTAPEKVYSSPTAMALLSEMKERLGPQVGVHPMINYISDYGDTPNPVIEYLALSALARALRQAQMFIQNKAPPRMKRPNGDETLRVLLEQQCNISIPSSPKGTMGKDPIAYTCDCGEKLDSSWKVCPDCQAPVVIPQTAPSSCSNCSYTLKPHWKTCPMCNTPCPCKKCGEILEQGFKVCPVCKTPVGQ